MPGWAGGPWGTASFFPLKPECPSVAMPWAHTCSLAWDMPNVVLVSAECFSPCVGGRGSAVEHSAALWATLVTAEYCRYCWVHEAGLSQYLFNR